jgi:anhydro-N-acetylmuramic acid kinase
MKRPGTITKHEVGGVGKLMRVLGLMSGTSMDGVDAALIDTDGESTVRRGPATTFPYNLEQRAALTEALVHARSIVRREDRPGRLAEAERMITELHAAAVSAFLRQHGIARSDIDAIGFHGHTVLHRPERRLTVQIGDGRLLARLTALPVVYDLRSQDVAAGGQGAPLVPVYHRALVAKRSERPIAVLNLGGVANVTWVGGSGDLIAFDTGPGNALIDDWMVKRTGEPYDAGGKAAGAGKVSDVLLTELLSHPYFSRLPPKSLDRNTFGLARIEGLSIDDGAATLAAFTAASIAKAREHFPEQPALWIVCGGGRKNRTLMSLIAGLVENAVVPAEAAGLDGDAIEAEAWAYLAARALQGLPISYPGTTGVARPLTGGLIARAQ